MQLDNIFKDRGNAKHFPKGSVVFSIDEPGYEMYVVLEGKISIEIGGKVIEQLSAGEMLGEMALINSEHRSATAIASEDSVLAVVDEKTFLFMVQQTPFFALHVMRVLASRLRNMNPAG